MTEPRHDPWERELSDLTFEAFDRPLRPGQYLFVDTHAWWLGTFGLHNHLTEHRQRQWVPAHHECEWLLERELTGRQTWLTGSADAAADEGFDLRDVGPVGLFRARYGDFDLSGGDERDGFCAPAPVQRRGSWQSPNAEFLARLPRDPALLCTQLQEENTGNWFGPFAAAVTALRTCLVPADLRVALAGALMGLPAVTLSEDVPNVDDRPCTAIVHDAGRTRTELFLDPVDGQFSGERDTLRMDSRCGLPAGTVISSTAVRTAVVDAMGALPAA